MMNPLKTEPVFTWASLLAILNALQVAAISMPLWAHTAILVVTTIVTAIMTRQSVTPASPPA